MIEILATLGPSSLKSDVIQKLSDEGVSLFRINLSHTPLEKIKPTIEIIQKNTKVPISLDTEGAQIRNQSMQNGTVLFKKGEIIKIHYESIVGDENNISFTPVYIGKTLEVGDYIEIDFHSTAIRVIEKKDTHCIAEVEIGGKVGSNKAVDVDRAVCLEPITEKDKAAIKIGKEMEVTHYALSFANTSDDVEQMRSLIGDDSKLISKIESRSGLENLEKILKATDAILIDRGDLSRQIAIEKIPFLQRKIIATAKYCRVPVYVATNLLESMIAMHLPTRAEVNDVASTLLMGADGLVLAAETAIGDNPIETIKMVNKLVSEYEKWTPNADMNQIIKL